MCVFVYLTVIRENGVPQNKLIQASPLLTPDILSPLTVLFRARRSPSLPPSLSLVLFLEAL